MAMRNRGKVLIMERGTRVRFTQPQLAAVEDLETMEPCRCVTVEIGTIGHVWGMMPIKPLSERGWIVVEVEQDGHTAYVPVMPQFVEPL